MASSPSDASPTIRNRASFPMTSYNPRRNTGWSSTMSIVTCCVTCCIMITRGDGNFNGHVGAAARPGIDGEGAFENAHAFGDAAQAITDVVHMRGLNRADVEADSVVANRKRNESNAFLDHHHRFGGGRMFHHIVHAFLHDSINMNL